MRDIPILMSAPMVRATLREVDPKGQTRRIMKQATGPSLSVGYEDGVAELSWLHGDGPGHDVHETIKRVPCPYGVPGDRLWVKETIRLVPDQEPDDGTGRVLSCYAADGALTVADAWPWRRKQLNSIHCPRGLSRITLEVTEVRVERLQEISEADAIAEGVSADPSLRGDDDMAVMTAIRWLDQRCGQLGSSVPIARYMVLWESLNGPGSWAANPHVWCISFKRL